MKKVLIVSYYWPPSGGIAVHRCLKFAKYLREFGWEPIVCTAENAEYPVIDESNFKDIPEGMTQLKTKIWEPYNLFKLITGKKKEERIHNVFLEEEEHTFAHKLGIWIRGNLFIPDARRFWIRPASKYLIKYLQENRVDAVFTNGPPHTNHMIAYKIKRKLGIPWHADFQDPWTQVDYFPQLMLNPISRKIHETMEQRVFKYADRVTICSNTWKRDLESIGAKNVGVIVWGYDEDDFKNIKEPLSNKFTLSHYGSLGPDRNAKTLWRVLSELAKEDDKFAEDLEIELAGFIGKPVIDEIENLGLKKNLKLLPHLSRSETLKKMHRSQVLLLILNDMPNVNGRLPGKLFEYLASRRPILVVGPEESDASEIVTRANAGVTCDFRDYEKTRKTVTELYEKFKKKELASNETDISEYTNRNLTKKLAGYLDEITGMQQH
ncbi:glycosyl transferase, group 1 [Melioribacter roseus P3M-2]|uniref:Glycosyl transferase, group 1 n=1 Tax=Melioribacter roseus (strain DSM 23840 / JCM 17771 / VKM B-2668 / P3M-2) TaxID=1191523 RepID=I6YUZ9_MELRP|nr:glycosyltransferase [Melioribacter roseus]AFN74387.1 glycosyl transferase, group 1 [Melioribacter roseus P3M-2]